ncbi:MAG: hypothetical protein EOP07_07210 [Proteobacteria bacterium]|nr:MAG: hypothetical protein EOP07_07210 [Pseudomonadota bacterium]
MKTVQTYFNALLTEEDGEVFEHMTLHEKKDEGVFIYRGEARRDAHVAELEKIIKASPKFARRTINVFKNP